MNEVLALIDDLKNVKQKLVGGDTTGAIKLIDETLPTRKKRSRILRLENEENEHKLEQSGVEEQYDLPFPEPHQYVKH